MSLSRASHSMQASQVNERVWLLKQLKGWWIRHPHWDQKALKSLRPFEQLSQLWCMSWNVSCTSTSATIGIQRTISILPTKNFRMETCLAFGNQPRHWAWACSLYYSAWSCNGVCTRSIRCRQCNSSPDSLYDLPSRLWPCLWYFLTSKTAKH